MTKRLRILPQSDQLKEACKLTRARWAAWLQDADGVWSIVSHAGLVRSRQEWLGDLLQQENTRQWLSGALSSKRLRWHEMGPLAKQAGCQLTYVFPDPKTHQLLIVGTDSLDKISEAFLRVLAMQAQQPIFMETTSGPGGELRREPKPELTSSPALMISTRSSGRISRQMQALLDTARDMAQLDSDQSDTNTQVVDLLQRVVQRVRELLEAHGAQLMMQDGSLITDLAPQKKVSASPIPSEALSLAHQYITTTEAPLNVVDFQAWSSLNEATPDRPLPEGWHALVGIPVRHNKAILGTLIVMDDRRQSRFTDADLYQMDLLCPQIGSILYQAHLMAELQERKAAQQLAESHLVHSARLAAVGEMAAGAAHELNNPLTTVTGFVELVLNELPADSTLRADLELALNEALRARSVVRGLLDFSRPSQDQRVPTDLNELISQVVMLVRHLLRLNNLTLRLELWDDLPLVAVDPNQIQQVLHNLMRNAIQAMPSGGTLTVGTNLAQELPDQRPNEAARDARNKWVRILVQDTGVGIPSENLGRIFEPFFTAHAQLAQQGGQERMNSAPGSLESDVQQSIGLGLSISYGIIRSHDGFIDVESTVGQGSRFTVYLPLGENSQ